MKPNQRLRSVKVAPEFCASQLKILADVTRLGILEILMDKPQQVGEINAVLGVEQSLLSHHLKVLRKAGLVESRRQGKAVLYSLAEMVKVNATGQVIDLGCCQLCFERKE